MIVTPCGVALRGVFNASTDLVAAQWSGEAVAKALQEGGADVVVCDIQGTKVEVPEHIDIVFKQGRVTKIS